MRRSTSFLFALLIVIASCGSPGPGDKPVDVNAGAPPGETTTEVVTTLAITTISSVTTEATPLATATPLAPASTAKPATTKPKAPATSQQAAEAPCSKALIGVRKVGLAPGFTFFCSSGKTDGHAGTTGWYGNGDPKNFVAVHPTKGNNPGVGAHEACHAQQFTQNGRTTEPEADRCAEANGYPNPFARDGLDERVRDESNTTKAGHFLLDILLVGLVIVVIIAICLTPTIRRRINRGGGEKA